VNVLYLHIGGDTVLRSGDIAGIFDFDGVTRQKASQDFLNRREKSGYLFQVRGDALPRSFVLTASDTVYLSPITAETLCKRLENRKWL
jgi:hypothetical protein